MKKIIELKIFQDWFKAIGEVFQWGTISVEFKDGKAVMVKIQESIKL